MKPGRITQIALAPALLLVLLTGGCDQGTLDVGGFCSTSSDCPPSQVCRDGACVSTCLVDGACATTSGALAGAISLAESTDLDTGESWLSANATFHATAGYVPTAVQAIAGTDCVMVQGDGHAASATCLSAGVITLTGGLLGQSGEPADGADGTASLIPQPTESGFDYLAELPPSALLAPGGDVVATAPGADVPAFQTAVPVPASIEGVGTDSSSTAQGKGLSVHWDAGLASQVLLRLTGTAAPPAEAKSSEQMGLGAEGANEADGAYADQEAALAESDLLPSTVTVICPARDEAGLVAVPPSALTVFEPGPLAATLARQNLGFAAVKDGTITVTATREVRFTVHTDAASN